MGIFIRPKFCFIGSIQEMLLIESSDIKIVSNLKYVFHNVVNQNGRFRIIHPWLISAQI